MHECFTDTRSLQEDKDRLEKALNRCQELEEQIKDRRAKNTADLAEIEFLKHQINESLENMKLRAVNTIMNGLYQAVDIADQSEYLDKDPWTI
jgi:ElaB/YqjD/DUF883 family membrane-anchored ribosome-binding protein